MIFKKIKKALVYLFLFLFECRFVRIFGSLYQCLNHLTNVNSKFYTCTRQIFVLLWKNWLIRKRFYFSTLIEFCLPILALLMQRQKTSSNDMLSILSSITSIKIEGLTSPDIILDSCVNNSLAYSPSNNFTDKIMNTLRGSNCTFDMVGFTSIYDAFDFRNDYNASSEYTFIFFKEDAKYFTYTIDLGNSRKEFEFETIEYHINNGLMGHLLNRTIPNSMLKLHPTTFNIELFFGPNRNWIRLAFFLHLIYLVAFQVTVKKVVNEKESGARDLLRLMGMSNLAYWSSHFLDSFIMLAFQGIIMTTVATTDWLSTPLLNHCSWLLYYLLFLSLGGSIILFAFFSTIFFNKTVVAMVVCGFTWIITVTLSGEKHVAEIQIGKAIPWSLSWLDFIPINSLVWISKLLTHFELTRTDASLFQFISKYQISLLFVLFIISFVSLIYIFLIYYIDAIWPFQTGSPKPWNFIFKSLSCERNLTNIFAEWGVTKIKDKNMEPLPQGSEIGAKLTNISKSFFGKNSCKYVVSKVSLEFAKGQIHALLGHNGAGKTTLINMLAGWLAPTSGTAEIAGYNVQTQTQLAQSNMTICPQQNLLFDDLTVEEHLVLFSVLKEKSFKASYLSAAQVLESVRLTDKRYTLSKNLSGGMKRKLHFAITMVGNTQIIILDEPTSGLDPESRRLIWDILLKLKHEKTILLCTHIMEEADALGDRVSIMYNGKLCCVGSTFFLKKLHKTGYMLHLSINERFVQAIFDEFIQSLMSNAYLQRLGSKEAVYCLPDVPKETSDTQDSLKSASNNHHLSTFFEVLEKEKENLGILSFNVSITTMNDVFMKVVQSNLINTTIETGYKLTSPGNYCKLTGLPFYLNQIKALFFKRVNYAKRHWQFHIFQMLVPSVITYFGFFFLNSFLDIFLHKTNPVETLNLATYPKQVFYVGSNLSAYFEKTVYELGGEVDIYETLSNIDIKRYDFGVVENTWPVTQVSDFILWSNQQPYSVALAITTIQNTLLDYWSNRKHNLITTKAVQMEQPLVFVAVLPLLVLNLLRLILPISLSFIASSFVLYPFKENQIKSKLIQRIAGVNGVIFWLSSYLFDILYYSFVVLIVIIVIYFQDSIEAVSSHITSLGSFFLLYFCFGYTVIPIGYLASYLPLDNANTAFNLLTFFYQIFSMIATFMVMYSRFQTASPSSSMIINLFVSFFPTLSISEGLIDVYKNGLIYKLCERVKSCSHNPFKSMMHQFLEKDENIMDICCAEDTSFRINYLNFSENGILIRLARMITWGSIIMVIILVMETNLYYYWYWFRNFIKYNISPADTVNSDEDEDVAQERDYVSELIERKDFDQEAMLVDKLTKRYSNLLAVENLSFSLHHKECFGLLGVNGAGKSTTFAMLTGDTFITHGNVYIKEYDIKNQHLQYLRDISYCPQFDALLENLTPTETLTLFARLRGVPEHCIAENVDYLVEMLGLQSGAKYRTGVLSGGTKRKLSLAIALIGSPSVILLDEPTTGIDPFSKTNLWSVLQYCQKENSCSMVFSSHSMEECEILCSRIGIMVKGQFRCLGSLQHLQNKHFQGYNFIIKLNELHLNNLKIIENYIEQSLKSIDHKELHGYIFSCFINDCGFSYSQIFRVMEHAKNHNLFEDFIISNVNLEQIFLSLLQN